MKFYLLKIIIVALLFISCNKKDSIPLIPEEETSKIPETTKILTENDIIQNFVSMSEDSTTFTFNSSVANNRNFKINDVLVIPKEEGLLRKITNIHTSGNQIIFNTTQASITEAIEEGKGEFSQTLVRGNIQKVTYYVEGVEIDTSGFLKPNNNQIYISLNSVLYDNDGNTNTTGDQIAINGSFSITPTIDGIFHFSGYSVKKIETRFSIQEQLNLGLDIGLIQFTGQREKKLATINFSTFIVPVGIPPIVLPVLITPEIDLFAGAKLELNSSISTGISQDLSHTIGLIYENGSWSKYQNNSENFSFNSPTVNTGVKTKFYIKPELKMKVYSVVSPYLSTELFGQFEANTSQTPWWKLYAGLNVGAGIKMQIFNNTVVNYGTNFLQINLQIAQATSTPPTVSTSSISNITSNSATGGGNVTSQGSSSVTARGVCWSTSQNPTINSNKTNNGTGIGSFTSNIAGLLPSTQYYLRAYATNSAGTSYGNQVSLTTAAGGTAPSAPTLSSPSNNATNISIPATLSWNASNGAASYTLQVSVNSSFTSYVYNQSGITNTSQQVSGLNNSTNYFWRVSATNSYGTSGWSTTRNYTTAAGSNIPSAPTLSSPSNGATSISTSPTLSWNSSSGSTSYNLQVSTSSGFGSYIYNQNVGNVTSKSISGLNSNTSYYWRVNATNSFGTSGWSTTRIFTTITQTGYQVYGKITDAINGNNINNATVKIKQGSTTISTQYSNSSGNYTFNNISNGSYSISVEKSGYISTSQNFSVSNNNKELSIYLSPISSNVDYRIVLQWGANPEDLDAHLYKGQYHIYYANKGNQNSPPYSVLDYDLQTGYGPETITIYKLNNDECKYYVHRYAGSPTITHSSAVVKVYSGNSLLKTYNVPTSGNGDWWYVFDITSSGNIIDKNYITSTGGNPGENIILK